MCQCLEFSFSTAASYDQLLLVSSSYQIFPYISTTARSECEQLLMLLNPHLN